MDGRETLSHAFLETHPGDAARVLERLPPSAAAALFQAVPRRLAGPVLRQMLPLAGARCLELMDDGEAAGLLHGVGAQAGAALLRHVGAERRRRLLAQLPTALGLAFDLLLGYPEGTVGACMAPHSLAFPSDMNCGEALERVRRDESGQTANPFVIDRNQRLLGLIELADLLRAQAATPLARLARPSPGSLPAQTLLAGLRDHPGWREASILPVVEQGNRLVGALSHATLERTLAEERHKPSPRHAADSLAGVAGAYWFGVSSLIETLVSLLPTTRREGEP